MGVQSILRIQATNHTNSKLFLNYTLSNGRYVRVRLYVFTTIDTNHKSLFRTNDYRSHFQSAKTPSHLFFEQ